MQDQPPIHNALTKALNAAGLAHRHVESRSGGVATAAIVAGEGPTVILMHGWPELGISWRHQAPTLALAGFRVVVPDMRGYGRSAKPADPAAYTLDQIADDMATLAAAIGAPRWIAVGHDWGAAAAWRCALRLPDQVAAVFCLSVPHGPPAPAPLDQLWDALCPDRFFYARYFQTVGPAERELEADIRLTLRKVFSALSGAAGAETWMAPRPIDAPLLPGLPEPPAGPLSFISDEELGQYVAAFEAGGLHGPLCWYRNSGANFRDAAAYGDGVVRQPAGFMCGDGEVVLAMIPRALERQRQACADLRVEQVVPGAGHWIQQERLDEVNDTLLAFLRSVSSGR